MENRIKIPLKIDGLQHRIIGPGDTWETAQMAAFVEGHRCSHFLQLPQWAKVKEAWQWQGILVYRQERIVGAMSVLIRALGLGLSVMYGPRGPVCDRSDPFVMGALFAAAEELAARHGALLLMLDPDEPESNGLFRELMAGAGFTERADAGFGNVQAQHVFRLTLAKKTEGEVFEAFCSKTRYNIRLAQRKGVQIRTFLGDRAIAEEELDAFTAIMDETGKRDRFIPRGKDYYRRVFQALGREAVLFMAYLGDTPIAGTIGVFSGKKAWYLYGASSNTHRNAMPNYLLQWEMIRMAMVRGCGFYDLRGVPGDLSEDNPLYGLYRFKKGFGGDYTKFTGLFVCRYRPVLARCFEAGLRVFRTLRAWKRCR